MCVKLKVAYKINYLKLIVPNIFFLNYLYQNAVTGISKIEHSQF